MNPAFSDIDPALAAKLPKSALPSRKFFWGALSIGSVLAFLIAAFTVLGINPFLFFTEFHYVANLANEMTPPDWGLLFDSAMLWSLGQTFSMAFLGTLVGGLLAFGLAFLAAKNTTPRGFLRPIFRTLLACQRVAPDYAILMIIVIAVGIGPFAGVIAIIIGSTGMFGKIFAD
ncbi:MAG: PhnE/PtxC family ABC transporter permease, partial [Verrucomicrobiota bacterium]